MIKLEGKGPVKEMELFFDVLCSYGLVKTRSKSYVNIEGNKSLIFADVGVPRSIYEADDLGPAGDEDQCFITEDQIPDKYLPQELLNRWRKYGKETFWIRNNHKNRRGVLLLLICVHICR